MAKARVRVPKNLEDFTRSDWKKAIREASLGRENTRIAEMYFLGGIPHVEIGAELGMSRSAVSKRMTRIVSKIELTAHKLHMV